MKIGAVAVPCNPLLRAADYDYFVEESRARLVRARLDRSEPREALNHGIISRLFGIRAHLAKPADRDVNDLRRRGAHVVGVPISAVYAAERSKLRPVRDTTRTCFLAVYYQFLERI